MCQNEDRMRRVLNSMRIFLEYIHTRVRTTHSREGSESECDPSFVSAGDWLFCLFHGHVT